MSTFLFSLILLPIIFSIIIVCFFNKKLTIVHKMSIIFSIVYFLLSLGLCFFDISGFIYPYTPIFVYKIPFLNFDLLNQVGINFTFGLDTLSRVMIVLTSFIFLIVTITTKDYIKRDVNLFYSLIFLLEGLLVALFTTTDMFLFFLFWELELIPMYLLISLWGNKMAKRSALKYIIYTFAGSLFILLGIILVYFSNFAINYNLSADLSRVSINDLNLYLQVLISIFFLVGFGVKLPIIPLHRWLAEAHTNSATPVSIILAAILLKLGIYGIIRFNISILTSGFVYVAGIVALFSLLNIWVGALLAYQQKNIKKIVAYSSISQMGIILFALTSLTKSGLIGVVYHSVSHGVVSAGLFLVAGIIKNQYKTNNINRISGLWNKSSDLYIVTNILALGTMGIPFLSGFIGEFLAIYSAFTSSLVILRVYAVFAILIIILSAAYILKLMHHAFYGEIVKISTNNVPFALHEKLALNMLCFAILFLGIFPMFLINILNG